YRSPAQIIRNDSSPIPAASVATTANDTPADASSASTLNGGDSTCTRLTSGGAGGFCASTAPFNSRAARRTCSIGDGGPCAAAAAHIRVASDTAPGRSATKASTCVTTRRVRLPVRTASSTYVRMAAPTRDTRRRMSTLTIGSSAYAISRLTKIGAMSAALSCSTNTTRLVSTTAIAVARIVICLSALQVVYHAETWTSD